jgi:hypothetical protein
VFSIDLHKVRPAPNSASRSALTMAVPDNKQQRIESSEVRSSVLRQRLSPRALAPVSLQTRHQFGADDEDPIKVRREFSMGLNKQAAAPGAGHAGCAFRGRHFVRLGWRFVGSGRQPETALIGGRDSAAFTAVRHRGCSGLPHSSRPGSNSRCWLLPGRRCLVRTGRLTYAQGAAKTRLPLKGGVAAMATIRWAF